MSTASVQTDAALPIAALLVAEQERIHTTLEPLLRQALPAAQLTWVRQCAQASSLAHELAPALIFIDDDLLHDDPMRLIRQLAQELPQVAVLALVDEANLVEARQSLLAGARAVITKPIQSENLIAKLAQIPIEAPPPPVASLATPSPVAPEDAPAPPATPPATDGHVIVFTAAKGGVGCTTLLANTAISLRELTGQTVVLVDAHFGAPGLDLALNLLEGPTWRTVIDGTDATQTQAALPALLTAHATGVHVLPAAPPGIAQEPPTSAQILRVINELRRHFDWVLVDWGEPFGAQTAALPAVAERVVVTVTPELAGLRNAQALLEALAQRDVAAAKLWLVLNRHGMAGGLSRADVEERLQLRVRHTVPDDAPPARASLNRGVPVVMTYPHSALSRALVELAQALAADVTAAEPLPLPPPPRRGAVTRLLGRLWGA